MFCLNKTLNAKCMLLRFSNNISRRQDSRIFFPFFAEYKSKECRKFRIIKKVVKVDEL